MDIPKATTVGSNSPRGGRSRMNDFTILRGRKVCLRLVSFDILDVVKSQVDSSLDDLDEIPFLIGFSLKGAAS